jgi:hypothetical protein
MIIEAGNAFHAYFLAGVAFRTDTKWRVVGATEIRRMSLLVSTVDSPLRRCYCYKRRRLHKSQFGHLSETKVMYTLVAGWKRDSSDQSRTINMSRMTVVFQSLVCFILLFSWIHSAFPHYETVQRIHLDHQRVKRITHFAAKTTRRM